MKTIYPLSNELVAQIAAGEVIERPSFAVKELLDNSLDAQATKISIELIDSGLTKIVVTDNGFGMSKEDILESYKLHTTSKIRKEEQLLSIKSLGFRGEALASIAAVSSVIIESKTHEEQIGTRIEVTHGTISTVSSLGMPDGTRVIVSNIFDNVPARKKFIKSKRTELKHILDTITDYALCHTSQSWSVAQNGKSILSLSANESFEERISALFGPVIQKGLLPISFVDSYISIIGFLTTPQSSTESLPHQYISINGRPVNDRLLTLAIKEAYGVLLSSDTTPSFFLKITVPFETVDVNIHPRKEEVHYSDERLIFDAMYRAVSETLAKYNLSYQMQFVDPNSSYNTKLTQTPLGHKLKEQVLPWNTTFLSSVQKEDAVLQIHNLYLVSQEENGLLLVDQHAAHERILYERFLEEFKEQKTKHQPVELSTPILVNFTALEIPVFEKMITDFTSLGFLIEPFSGTTYRILSVPSTLVGRNIEECIKDLVNGKDIHKYTHEIDTNSKKLLAYLACKSAIKAGDPLTHEQQKDIVKELRKLPHAVTCPHGRPLKIEISFEELAKLFKRS
jgi:DNA mismatch repair protein MutL